MVSSTLLQRTRSAIAKSVAKSVAKSKSVASWGAGLGIGTLLALIVALVLGVWLLNRYYGPERFTDGGKASCVLYKAEWCGHCKEFKPEWDAAAAADKGISCNWVKRDADEDAKLMATKNVTSFPTIRYERPDDTFVEYSGERTKEALITWVQAQK